MMCLFSLIFQIFLLLEFFTLLPSYSLQSNSHTESLFKNKLKYCLKDQQITFKIMCLLTVVNYTRFCQEPEVFEKTPIQF